MTEMTALLSAKAKYLVLHALLNHRNALAMRLVQTSNDDEVADLANDVWFADTVISTIEAWEVKRHEQ